MSWDRRTQYNLLNSINRKLPKVDFSNLLIDTREKKTKPVKFLLSKGINLKFQKLPVGDYYFPSEEILIERKVVSDLHKSLEQ
jgi:ERCC4-type nuclease